MRLIPLVLLFLLFTGCGYHFGEGCLATRYRTITVPYICGDQTGEMTAALIRELSRSSALEYRSCGGEVILKVSIIELCDGNIGYRYDTDKKGEFTHSLIPSETRLTALAEVTLIERASGRRILRPARISASVDFDHEYFFTRDGINVFSLGQLTDYDEAYEAVLGPLGRVLAEKIVDYVVHGW